MRSFREDLERERESRRLPFDYTPFGGTPYLTCPDHPKVCSHPKGECPADRQAVETGTASFKRIA